MSAVLVTAALTALWLCAVYDFASGTLWEGSPCFHEASQSRGVCKLLPYCSWAVKERRSELYPQACSFDGYMPVVCCPYTRTHDPPHLPLRPARPGLLSPGGPPFGDADLFIDALSKPAEDTTPKTSPPPPPPSVETDVDNVGPLGPLRPSSTGSEVRPDSVSLQEVLDQRISDDPPPAPTGLPAHLQFGDGSGLAFLTTRA